MSHAALDIVELLITAQIYNKYTELDVNDLPKNIRKKYWSVEHKSVPKPIKVSISDVQSLYEIKDLKTVVKALPFINIDDVDFKVKLTSFGVGEEWFEKQDEAKERFENNPVLAFYYEKKTSSDADYKEAKAKSRPKEVDREWIESLVSEVAEEEGGDEMLKLVHIVAPEDVRQPLDELVLTNDQIGDVEKIVKAIQYREYLKRIGLYDLGKLLFVGPPGTGKTSVASALSERLSIPFVEVKLSMITDQYLGETAKNIDRVFNLAKRLSPCILFIDEFDFVAKTRASDEHAALKRAVNTLLKAIDTISLTNDGVLLIAATNHPKMLDMAAWRRFDEIMSFPLPTEEMREKILDIVLRDIDGTIDTKEIASLTEGYAGSDLRMIIREAVLSALVEERMSLTQDDMINAVGNFNEREGVRTDEYAI